MKESPLPYRQLIFVCTNARPEGQRISCAGEGRCGEKILHRLKDYVKENHLEDLARVAKSGCQEKCEIGPNMAVMPQNIFLSGVTEADISEIIRKFLAPLIKKT